MINEPQNPPMYASAETVVLYTRLRPGMGEAYDEFHRTVPPAVAGDLIARGVTEWRIWRHGRHLFHLVTVADYAAFLAGDAGNPVSESWQAAVAPFLEASNTSPDPDQNTARLVWALSTNGSPPLS